jgi:hypothetical protein
MTTLEFTIKDKSSEKFVKKKFEGGDLKLAFVEADKWAKANKMELYYFTLVKE